MVAAMNISVPAVLFERSWYSTQLDEVADEVKMLRDGGVLLYPEDVFAEAIAAVRHCGLDEARQVKEDIHADNPEETQRDVPLFDVLVVSITGDTTAVVEALPVPGTSVVDGYVVPCPFYQRTRRNGISYGAILTYVLYKMCRAGDANLTCCLINIVEASFNCWTRHKEVFEYTMRCYFEARQSGATRPCPGVDIKEAAATTGAASGLDKWFMAWLDRYKMDALSASVINPLLYLFRDKYTVYENLASHGTSFWGTLFEAVSGVPMPYEHIPQLEKGWCWAARHVDPASPSHADVLARCAAGIGRDWRACMAGAPDGVVYPTSGCLDDDVAVGARPRVPPRNMKLLRTYASLPALLDAVAARRLSENDAAEIAVPLRRFLALFTIPVMVESFAYYLINRLDVLPPAIRALDPCAWVDACDPENITIDEQAVLAALAAAGISLRPETRATCLPVGADPEAPRARAVAGSKLSRFCFFWWRSTGVRDR